MKLALAFVTVLATVSQLDASGIEVPASGTGALAKDLQEFVNLLNVNKVVELTKVYLANDKEFQWVISFMQSDDMKDYLHDLADMPQFKKLLDYLMANGLDSYSLLEFINDAMNHKPKKIWSNSGLKISGGLSGYFSDLVANTPVYGWTNLFEYKVATSIVFKNFVDEILSPQYTNLFTSTFDNEHFANVLKQLQYLDIDSETFHTNFSTLLVVKALIYQYERILV
ncbi:PREDICTED: uncharacterized protein LOC108546054 [Eufriesea mexicana]|uniref:uncharacterized protein LOC108546054 n=1 Tax=Eufriesea mexicana TaxID=516756 RepID=UPI00083BE8C4|nr:PREDICTED: uncharacterized protein LOC108546054 [Eufriesea mexicana]